MKLLDVAAAAMRGDRPSRDTAAISCAEMFFEILKLIYSNLKCFKTKTPFKNKQQFQNTQIT